MRIALFTDTNAYYEDGVGRWIRELLAYMSRQDRHHLLLFHRDGGAERSQSCGPHATVYNVSSPCVTIPTYKAYPWFYLGSPRRRLRRVTERFRPDVILTVSPYFLFGIGRSALWIADKLGVPLWGSFDLHMLLVCRQHGLTLFKYRWVSWLAFKTFARMLQSYSRCSKILVPSQFIRDHVDQEYGAGKAVVFRRGVDCRQFSPSFRDETFKRDCGIEGKTAILYVGRLSVEKNLMALIDSYLTLKSRHPQIALVLVGEGPDRKRIQERHGEDLVLTGALNGNELGRAYASADIFGFPGLVETGGQAIVEAMASGLPPVVFDQGAAHENVRHRATGLVAATSQTFTESLDELIRDADLRTELGTNARHHAEAQSWDAIFNRLFPQIEESLGVTDRSPNPDNDTRSRPIEQG